MGSVWSVVFVSQINVSANWTHHFTCLFNINSTLSMSYMTIKSHFNRSTMTKTVSWVPVSFEISIWKSHLKETRLQLFFVFIYIYIYIGGWLFHFEKKNTHYIIFHKTYIGDISWQLRILSGCRSLSAARYKLSPTSLADVPRATSTVLGPPESSQSRALVAHAGLAIQQPPCYITWDIAANRHHYVGHHGESALLRTK